MAIANRWELSDEERRLLLGSPTPTAFDGWVAAARHRRDLLLPEGALTRVSAVLGIHQALEVLYPGQKSAFGWLRRSHDGLPFEGRSPLAFMCHRSLDDLIAVRRSLDALVAGHGLALGPTRRPEARHGRRS